MTIHEYMKSSGLTYKQVFDRIKRGDLHAVKAGKSWDILDQRQTATGPAPGQSRANLNDAYKAVKIKREQQHLFEAKLALAIQVIELCKTEYVIPLVAALTECVRKHGADNERLINEWNELTRQKSSGELLDRLTEESVKLFQR